jgi:hypothetical protein
MITKWKNRNNTSPIYQNCLLTGDSPNYIDPGLSIRGGTRYFYLPKMVFGTS